MSRIQSGPISTNGAANTAQERYLRHKKQLHEQLITGMDLSAIGAMNEDELRVEVRRAAEELCRHSADLLNLTERERLVSEVLDETFGLGPLEPLMRDPTITDILINGPKTAYVERKGRLERVDVAFNDERHLVQIVQRIVGPGRPAGGRDQPDGRRPACRRQPRQRDHPAAGARRHLALDPAVRGPAAACSTT